MIEFLNSPDFTDVGPRHITPVNFRLVTCKPTTPYYRFVATCSRTPLYKPFFGGKGHLLLGYLDEWSLYDCYQNTFVCENVCYDEFCHHLTAGRCGLVHFLNAYVTHNH